MPLIENIKTKLAKYPHVRFQEDKNSLHIFPVDEDGFEIHIEDLSSSYFVSFEGFHLEFEDIEEAMNFIAFGLSEDCRLQVVSRGNFPYKWAIEYKENGRWVMEEVTALIFFPYWRKKTIAYKQNHLIKEE